MPSKGLTRGDKGTAPSSPTANAASARNTAVAGEVILSLQWLCCSGTFNLTLYVWLSEPRQVMLYG